MLGTRSCLNLAKHLVALSKFSFAELRSVSLDVILDNPEDAANDEPVRSIHREEPRQYKHKVFCMWKLDFTPHMLIVWKGDERNLCSPGC